jgi:tRNA modification GTPase
VAAVETILDDLRNRGVVILAWSQWIQQQSADPLQTAAQIELTRALTLRAAGILLDQYRGALRAELEALLVQLQQRDISDGPFRGFQHRLLRLRERSSVGLHLTQPWRVALVGPPNVGKSSLLNRLVGFQRAIVYDQPGTTRDVVTAHTAFDGWPVELFDMAGMRETSDQVEQSGVVMARQAARQADLLVFLVETDSSANAGRQLSTAVESGSRQGEYPDLQSLQLPTEVPVIRVLSKWDLRASENREAPDGWLGISSKTGEGLETLMEAITRRLVPDPPHPGEPVPFLPHHRERLEACLQSLQLGSFEQAENELSQLLADQRGGGPEGPGDSSLDPF